MHRAVPDLIRDLLETEKEVPDQVRDGAQAMDGLRTGWDISSVSSNPLADTLDQTRSYSELSYEVRKAVRKHDFQECRELIGTTPLAGTATAGFVCHQLAAIEDHVLVVHAMGLLFPLTLIDLVARLAPHYVGDIFAFAPVRDHDGRVVRPMRRMMDRLHAETGFTSQEETFRALFWTHGPLEEFDKDDTRWPTFRDRGWSYRAISRADRQVPRWVAFGQMIDTASKHLPENAPTFEQLRGQFWQVCLYENLLSFCEDLKTRVPDIDPLMVFQDIDALKARHDVTAARPGPQSSE